jgi:hypothetical protein
MKEFFQTATHTFVADALLHPEPIVPAWPFYHPEMIPIFPYHLVV